MDIIDVTLISLIGGTQLLNILIVAIGLGLVIFFHELGHFMVAKWCGVYVERFSIGFGQPILAKKWGETEYVLGWLPFGGYVKMLGQDDMDPNQMTDEQVAENPRSYTSKSVPQRMAIISAGVIMNIITGMMFFMMAFGSGIETVDRSVGFVQVGMPAWERGMRTGDVITSINDRGIDEFNDILRRTTLSRGPVEIRGHRATGETFEFTVLPELKKPSKIRRIIGVGPGMSLDVIDPPDAEAIPVALPGTAASRAGFEPGDRIQAVDGVPVQDYYQLMQLLGQRAGEAIDLTVERKSAGKAAQVHLPAEKFLGLGMTMGMGKIEAVQDESPARAAGLLPGDRIISVNGLNTENDLDPFRLTEVFSEHAGEEVTLTVLREGPGSPDKIELTLVPNNRAPWSEPPIAEDSPLSIPSIGVAYHLVPTVFAVREESPAAKQGIQPRDEILKMELVKSTGSAPDGLEKSSQTIPIGTKNWAYAFWMIQEQARTRTVFLTVKPANSEIEKRVELQPREIADWPLPTTRGLRLSVAGTVRKADSLSESMAMGMRYTLNSMEDIYLTLRGLLTGDISPKGLSGPIGITKIAYSFASVGLAHFALFLGLISINLAVINFLPIPVLDGGHMVFLLWEGLARRKPNEKVVATATYFGLAFVLGLMLFVIYLDLFVPKE